MEWGFIGFTLYGVFRVRSTISGRERGRGAPIVTRVTTRTRVSFFVARGSGFAGSADQMWREFPEFPERQWATGE